jgi:hypothetical protein
MVMCIKDNMDVFGLKAKLPAGQYVMPVFDDLKDATEFAGDEFQVICARVPKPENINKDWMQE